MTESYRAPGIRVTLAKNPARTTRVASERIPVIIGPGLQTLTTTEYVIRGEGTSDTLKNAATTLVRCGSTKFNSVYAVSGDSAACSINAITATLLDWSAVAGVITPAQGVGYYVTYTYAATDAQYEPTLCSGGDQIEAKYGPDVVGGVVNELSLAGQICARAGAGLVYMAQVETAGETMTSAELASYLEDKLWFLTDAYRIVPVAVSSDNDSELLRHVNMMSTEGEAKWRCLMTAASGSPTTAEEVISTVGTYAETLSDFRASVIYPSQANIVLSDGNTYTVGAGCINAALAGWKCAQKVQRSFTRARIDIFSSLVGIQMKNGELNRLAGKGVMILQQPVKNGPIVVRHGISTDTSSIQTKELSITDIHDFCAKDIVAVLDPYLGVENITPEYLTQVQGTVNTRIAKWKKDKAIVSGSITNIMQDAENPDLIVLQIFIFPPYPCNGMDIVIFMQ